MTQILYLQAYFQLLASRAWAVVAAPYLVGSARQARGGRPGLLGHSPRPEEQGFIAIGDRLYVVPCVSQLNVNYLLNALI